MEIIKLIGVVIIVLGFALKLDVLAVVLVAGIVTGLVSGLDFFHILEIIGTSFVNNRLMSIFLIMFPVIAIIERFGMKERAAYLIGKIKNASAGKVLSLWIVIRSLACNEYSNWRTRSVYSPSDPTDDRCGCRSIQGMQADRKGR